ncbi:hypothetical protein D3C81_08270 [compost metagenome]
MDFYFFKKDITSYVTVREVSLAAVLKGGNNKYRDDWSLIEGHITLDKVLNKYLVESREVSDSKVLCVEVEYKLKSEESWENSQAYFEKGDIIASYYVILTADAYLKLDYNNVEIIPNVFNEKYNNKVLATISRVDITYETVDFEDLDFRPRHTVAKYFNQGLSELPLFKIRESLSSSIPINISNDIYSCPMKGLVTTEINMWMDIEDLPNGIEDGFGYRNLLDKLIGKEVKSNYLIEKITTTENRIVRTGDFSGEKFADFLD